MQCYGNEIFSAFHRFRHLKISSILPGISMAEMGTLRTIEHYRRERGEDAKVTVSEVARFMRVAAPAISRTLRSLEEKELAERMVCEGDRRNVYIRITEKGKAVLNECDVILSELIQAVTEKMGEDDMKQLLGYLNKLEQTAEIEIEKRKAEKKGAKNEENI